MGVWADTPEEEENNKHEGEEERIEKLSKIFSPLRLHIDNLYDMQKNRISHWNRIIAYLKQLGFDFKDLKIRTAIKKIGKAPNIKKMEQLIEEEMGKLGYDIKEKRVVEIMKKMESLMSDVIIMQGIEKHIDKLVLSELVNYDVYTIAFKKIKGIGGPRLSGALIAWIEKYNEETCKIESIERFPHVSSLWKHAGLAPGQKRVKGEKGHFNVKLKTHILKIGDQFIKTPKHFYRNLYLQRKAFEKKNHPEPIPDPTGRKSKSGKPIMLFTKRHIHYRARRWMCKIFVQNVYVVWRKIKGLPVEKPWPLEHGHVDLIYPPEWAEYFKS